MTTLYPTIKIIYAANFMSLRVSCRHLNISNFPIMKKCIVKQFVCICSNSVCVWPNTVLLLLLTYVQFKNWYKKFVRLYIMNTDHYLLLNINLKATIKNVEYKFKFYMHYRTKVWRILPNHQTSFAKNLTIQLLLSVF